MSIRPRRVALLLTVVLLAATLALTLSRGAVAGSLFQSSPLLPTDTPTSILTFETPTPAPDLFATPEPVILPTDTPEAAPLVPGFLPAPTLTNPNDLVPGGSLIQPGQPPLSSEAAPVGEPEPTTEPALSGPAELIDSAVVALGYAWLCCGAGLLALAAVAFVWLMRRSARRRSRI